MILDDTINTRRLTLILTRDYIGRHIRKMGGEDGMPYDPVLCELYSRFLTDMEHAVTDYDTTGHLLDTAMAIVDMLEGGKSKGVRGKYWRNGEQSHIENYEQAKADGFRGWCIHHRLELNPDGTTRFTKNELVNKGLYWNRPAEELVYMRITEHYDIHRKSNSLLKRKKMLGRKLRSKTASERKHLSTIAKKQWARKHTEMCEAIRQGWARKRRKK